MNFDFNRYSEEELIELNRKIIEHVRLRRQRESQQAMDRFNLEETICFRNGEGDLVQGKIVSFNKKTVTIERGDCGHRCRISPQFLEKVVEHKKEDRNVITIHSCKVETSSSEKFSRNAPCPCGSGRKFKRCCMGKFKRGDLSKANIPDFQLQ